MIQHVSLDYKGLFSFLGKKIRIDDLIKFLSATTCSDYPMSVSVVPQFLTVTDWEIGARPGQAAQSDSPITSRALRYLAP